VSTAMVLVARRTVLSVLPEKNCFPFVCDLATANDLPDVLCPRPSALDLRLFTFFGMIPNFEPQIILPKLASLIRPQDFLLFSANLAPGKNYAAGVMKILPQYDNPLTRDWLLTFLLDLGVGPGDGELRFSVAAGALSLKRVVADFHFTRRCRIQVENVVFNFRAGETFRLFFSYRYSPARVCKLLVRYGLEVCGQWITRSEEEGVLLCRRK